MIGDLLGPYRIDREVGSGGMGKVFLATVQGDVEGLEPGMRVAVKVVHPNLLDNQIFLQRFLREAKLGYAVNHPNVVRTYDAGKVPHEGSWQHVLVMEYVEGQTLRALLDELERVPEELCRHVGREVARGLAAIHAAGAIHRDMKPENVLITPDHVVKIMDLGVAQLADEALRLSQTGTVVGTVQYVAPEQLQGKEAEVDGRTDLYGLGLLLYELAGADNPFLAENVAQILLKVIREEPRRLGEVNPQTSPFYEEVVHTLLAKEPGGRFATAEDLAQTLDEGERSGWWRERATVIRSETRQALRRVRIPRETAVHGREDELEALRELFLSAKGGEGQIVLVEGEAGVGKSRLVDELISRLHEGSERLDFLCGGYPPGGAATPTGAFVSAFLEHFGEGGLDATVERYLAPAPALAPAFAALLRGEPAPEGQQPLTPDTLRTAFVHATRGLAEKRPTVLLIDDLHHAPDEGRELFGALARGIEGSRVLLIGTTRPGLPEDWLLRLGRRDNVARVSLERLSAVSVESLLRDAFGSAKLATSLAEQVHAKSEGNPFFLFEILRELREEGWITQQPGGKWAGARPIDTVEIPATVLDLVNARVAALPQEDRDLLEIAACCGFEFDPELLAAVRGGGRIPILKQLARVEQAHRLVRASGRLFVFDHHQVHEALYSAVPDMLRESYHGEIATALERLTLGRTGPADAFDGAVAVQLCEHLLAGGRQTELKAYLERALDHLDTNRQVGPAISLAQRALALDGAYEGVERAALLLRLADRQGLAARRHEQKVVLEEALGLAKASGDQLLLSKAARALGSCCHALARFEEAQTHCRTAMDAARQAGDQDAEADAMTVVGLVAFAAGDVDEAQYRFERARRLARVVGNRPVEMRATQSLATLLHQRGRLEEARDEIRQQLQIARDTDDLAAQATGLGSLGAVLLAEGDLRQAKALFERHLELSQELGDRAGEALATSRLGLVAYSVCDFVEAEDRHRRALELARETGDRHGQARSLGDVGRVLEATGHHEDARHHHEWALALSKEIRHTRIAFLSMARLGGVLVSLGEYADAQKNVRGALSLAQQYGDQRTEAALWVRLAQLRVLLGDRKRASKALGAAQRVAQGKLAPRSAGLAAETVAEIAEQAGNFQGARDGLGDALHHAQKSGDSALEAQIHVELARLADARGDKDEAVAHVGLARAAAEDAGVPAALVLAAVADTRFAGADPARAFRLLVQNARFMDVRSLLRARHLMYEATKELAHLEAALKLVTQLQQNAPDDYRVAVEREVPLNRAISEAWSNRRK